MSSAALCTVSSNDDGKNGGVERERTGRKMCCVTWREITGKDTENGGVDDGYY